MRSRRAGPGIALTLVPMRHWAARHLLDRNEALWAACVIETPAGTVYHVANSGYGEAAISARRASGTDRSGSPYCRSAPTNRAGSSVNST